MKLGYGTDDYAGSGLTDDRYFVSVGADLQIQPRMADQDRIAAGLADRLTAGKLVHGNIGPARPALAALNAGERRPAVRRF